MALHTVTTYGVDRKEIASESFGTMMDASARFAELLWLTPGAVFRVALFAGWENSTRAPLAMMDVQGVEAVEIA